MEEAAEVLNDPPRLVTCFCLGDELPNVLIELLKEDQKIRTALSYTLVAVRELLLQQLKSQDLRNAGFEFSEGARSTSAPALPPLAPRVAGSGWAADRPHYGPAPAV